MDKSKLQLQRHLDRAWPAGLIEGVQADAADAAAQTSPEHRGRKSEEAAREVADGVAKIRAVEEVEGVRPELQVDSFSQLEAAAQAEV